MKTSLLPRLAVCAAIFALTGLLHAADMPNLANLVFHLDASQISANNGDRLDTWTDLAKGNNVTQGDASRRPTYVANCANLNNMPAVYFDGGNWLTNEGWNLVTGNGQRTVIGVWADAVDTGANNQHLLHFGNFANGESYGIVPFNGGSKGIGWHYHSTSGATYITGGSNPNLAMNYYNGTTDYVTANGLMGKINTPTLNTGTTRLDIGAHCGNGEQMRGNVAEVLIFDRKLTTKEQQQIGSYLTEKYDLDTTYLAAGQQNIQAFHGPDAGDKFATVFYGPNAANNGYDFTTPRASAAGCGLQPDGTYRLLSQGAGTAYMRNNLYFNNEGYGSSSVVATFDLRITPGTGSNTVADGLNFTLVNTDKQDPAIAFTTDGSNAEGRGLADSLSLGFAVYNQNMTRLY